MSKISNVQEPWMGLTWRLHDEHKLMTVTQVPVSRVTAVKKLSSVSRDNILCCYITLYKLGVFNHCWTQVSFYKTLSLWFTKRASGVACLCGPSNCCRQCAGSHQCFVSFKLTCNCISQCQTERANNHHRISAVRLCF